MAEGEEPLGSSGVDTVGVTVPEKDATVGGVTMTAVGSDDVEVGLGEPLVPLQDPWYCASVLFPAAGASKVSPPRAPKMDFKRRSPQPRGSVGTSCHRYT